MENHNQKVSQFASLSKPEVLILLFICIIGLCFVVTSFVICLTPSTPPNSLNEKNIDTRISPTNAVVMLGTPCLSEKACGYNLKCIGPSMKTMTCQCPDSDHQIYVDKQSVGRPRCVGKVGSACHPKFLNDCVENAHCTRMSSSSSSTSINNTPKASSTALLSSPTNIVNKFSEFRCECQTGFAANSRRECDVAFGSPCSNTTPCQQDAGLACREGECKCKNRDDIFELDRGQCSVPLGGSCKDDVDCVQFSKCLYRRNYGWGRCRDKLYK